MIFPDSLLAPVFHPHRLAVPLRNQILSSSTSVTYHRQALSVSASPALYTNYIIYNIFYAVVKLNPRHRPHFLLHCYRPHLDKQHTPRHNNPTFFTTDTPIAALLQIRYSYPKINSETRIKKERKYNDK